jgi:hypothetical protein
VDPIIDHAPAARASSSARRSTRDTEYDAQPGNKINIAQTTAKYRVASRDLTEKC